MPHKVAVAKFTGSAASFEQAARDCLCSDPASRYHFRDISFEFSDGVLTVHGCVPSFYLKQIIQTRLKDLSGVNRVDSQVDVVNGTGLSSTRPR